MLHTDWIRGQLFNVAGADEPSDVRVVERPPLAQHLAALGLGRVGGVGGAPA